MKFILNCPPSSQSQIIFHRFGQLQWCLSCLYRRWSIRWRCFQGIQRSQLLFFLSRNFPTKNSSFYLVVCVVIIILFGIVTAWKTKCFPFFWWAEIERKRTRFWHSCLQISKRHECILLFTRTKRGKQNFLTSYFLTQFSPMPFLI